ncbi:Cof-type HAD-IIB family hydrolase [Anaeromicropila herbilytica]|uniref:Haloacid dehalogenase n=1 Tax=Anaeromicropila herbilytica TaxID=2785025 RepID=A0A7R7EPR5_9FIRM|nr:Cof-type HAD-IIB family hydrolase [Anaeromicropila herbilytica]BCN32536.1 haloacid dehalogenase [Anaeromicropila herbilytica]
MKYKVLVLDIDGTVTNSNKEITEKTLNAIINIQKQGCTVVLASGRPTPGIMPVANELKLSEYGGYILSFNGAKIINCKTNEIIYQKTLPLDIVPTIYEEAKQNEVGLVTYEGDKVISGTGVDEFVIKEANINKINIKEVDNFPEYVTFDINKCLMTGEPKKLEALDKELNGKYGEGLSIYRSEPFFLEIMPKNIDKAYSLEQLCKHLHITKDEMIAVGDGFNDLSMIRYAGLGVAMDNAQDKVKEVADHITKSNDEDGVAFVIEKFMMK